MADRKCFVSIFLYLCSMSAAGVRFVCYCAPAVA